jgi:hypothetical protein
MFAMWDLANVQLDSVADFIWMFVVWDCANVHLAPCVAIHLDVRLFTGAKGGRGRATSGRKRPTPSKREHEWGVT